MASIESEPSAFHHKKKANWAETYHHKQTVTKVRVEVSICNNCGSVTVRSHDHLSHLHSSHSILIPYRLTLAYMADSKSTNLKGKAKKLENFLLKIVDSFEVCLSPLFIWCLHESTI